MTLRNFEKGCPPWLSFLGEVLFVLVVLSLASLSRFPLEWRFCPARGMHRCCRDTLAVLPVVTGLRSLRASPLERRVTKEELMYRTIKYNKMG